MPDELRKLLPHMNGSCLQIKRFLYSCGEVLCLRRFKRLINHIIGHLRYDAAKLQSCHCQGNLLHTLCQVKWNAQFHHPFIDEHPGVPYTFTAHLDFFLSLCIIV
jgi:hypothetical protein